MPTPQEIAQAIKIVQRSNARDNYYSYVKYVHTDMGYRPNRLGEYICKKIDYAIKQREKMLAGEIPKHTQRLIFSVPPQHGKSMHITETLPSYFISKFQEESAIVASYGDDLASSFGKKNRDKIKQYGKEIFNVELDSSSSGVKEFGLKNHRGSAKFAGILSGITGKPANLMIIDDPIRNREQANSETIREKIWQEWKDTLRTRIHPCSIVIVILTRWHEDDIVGRLLDTDHGKVMDWDYNNIPLLCDSIDDPLQRQLDEQVIPNRFSEEEIEEIKSNPDTYNSLYQGHPTAAEGNIIKTEWWKYYDELPICKYWVMSVDATFKDTDGSDFVTVGIWGKLGKNYYLVDLINQRLDFINTITAITTMENKHKDKKLHAVYIEDKANGSGIITVLRHRFDNVVAINPKDSKVTRVWAVTPIIQAGSVYLPKFHAITESFVNQCSAFPRGAHDDMVDNMTQALSQLKDFDGFNAKPLEEFKAGEERYEEYQKRLEEYESNQADIYGGNDILLGGFETYMG